jgi:hypothetical protein
VPVFLVDNAVLMTLGTCLENSAYPVRSRQSCARMFGVWLRFVGPERESLELNSLVDDRLRINLAFCLWVLVAGCIVSLNCEIAVMRL